MQQGTAQQDMKGRQWQEREQASWVETGGDGRCDVLSVGRRLGEPKKIGEHR